LGKLFPTWLSSPWFIVIGGDWRLTLLASKLSADGFGNPPNAGIEGLAAARSVRPATSHSTQEHTEGSA
jgi:hypothetical protein